MLGNLGLFLKFLEIFQYKGVKLRQNAGAFAPKHPSPPLRETVRPGKHLRER
jgi:hypothetical protein